MKCRICGAKIHKKEEFSDTYKKSWVDKYGVNQLQQFNDASGMWEAHDHKPKKKNKKNKKVEELPVVEEL